MPSTASKTKLTLLGGRLILAGANIYTGVTTVAGGFLRLSGSLTVDTAITNGRLELATDTALGSGTLRFDAPNAEITALSLHDALPISVRIASIVTARGAYDLTFTGQTTLVGA